MSLLEVSSAKPFLYDYLQNKELTLSCCRFEYGGTYILALARYSCVSVYVLFIQILSISFLDLVSYHRSLPLSSEWYCEWMVIGKF